MNSITALKKIILNINDGDYSAECPLMSSGSATRNRRYKNLYEKIVNTQQCLFSKQCLEIADKYHKDGAIRRDPLKNTINKFV